MNTYKQMSKLSATDSSMFWVDIWMSASGRKDFYRRWEARPTCWIAEFHSMWWCVPVDVFHMAFLCLRVSHPSWSLDMLDATLVVPINRNFKHFQPKRIQWRTKLGLETINNDGSHGWKGLVWISTGWQGKSKTNIDWIDWQTLETEITDVGVAISSAVVINRTPSI